MQALLLLLMLFSPVTAPLSAVDEAHHHNGHGHARHALTQIDHQHGSPRCHHESSHAGFFGIPLRTTERAEPPFSDLASDTASEFPDNSPHEAWRGAVPAVSISPATPAIYLLTQRFRL